MLGLKAFLLLLAMLSYWFQLYSPTWIALSKLFCTSLISLDKQHDDCGLKPLNRHSSRWVEFWAHACSVSSLVIQLWRDLISCTLLQQVTWDISNRMVWMPRTGTTGHLLTSFRLIVQCVFGQRQKWDLLLTSQLLDLATRCLHRHKVKCHWLRTVIWMTSDNLSPLLWFITSIYIFQCLVSGAGEQLQLPFYYCHYC